MSEPTERVSVRVPRCMVGRIDLLVARGEYACRSDAIRSALAKEYDRERAAEVVLG